MRQPFQAERAAFEQFKRAVENDPVLKDEIETSLVEVLERYSTRVRENRFIVGGVVEVILIAALRAAGIDARDVGMNRERIDIEIPGGGFSVKGRFRPNQKIRLVNVLGESHEAKWNNGTLFVLYDLGIGYADPELISSEDATKREKDAIVLKYSILREFLRGNSEWLIKCRVPKSSDSQVNTEHVSRALARQILERTQKLRTALPND